MYELVKDNEPLRSGEAPMSFASYKIALAFAVDLSATGQPGYGPRKVRFTATWQEREAKRLLDGTYKPVPLSDFASWCDVVDANPEHFVHMSRKQPGKVAYTENAQKGAGDVQTPIAFSEYLLHKCADVLCEEDMDRLCAHFDSMTGGFELRFVRTGAEMAELMTSIPSNGSGHATEVSSCMTGDVFGSRAHPYTVFGEDTHNGVASDITLAVLMSGGVVKGRTLVWPARKIWTRMYGLQNPLRAALRAEGYTSEGIFAGATIKKIEGRHGTYVMPYLDRANYVSDYGDRFKITLDGGMLCDSVNGYISATPEEEEEEENDEAYCLNCEDYGPDEDSTLVISALSRPHSWCLQCTERHAFYCHGARKYYASYDHALVEIDNREYSETWLTEDQTRFNFCDESDSWFEGDIVRVVIARGREAKSWSTGSAAKWAFVCRTDERWYSNRMLSPHMQEGEAPIALINDDRDFAYHAIPEQGVLALDPIEPAPALWPIGSCVSHPYYGDGTIEAHDVKDAILPYAVRFGAHAWPRWPAPTDLTLLAPAVLVAA